VANYTLGWLDCPEDQFPYEWLLRQSLQEIKDSSFLAKLEREMSDQPEAFRLLSAAVPNLQQTYQRRLEKRAHTTLRAPTNTGFYSVPKHVWVAMEQDRPVGLHLFYLRRIHTHSVVPGKAKSASLEEALEKFLPLGRAQPRLALTELNFAKVYVVA